MSDKNPIIALVGNPNTGKSTIFNTLTGMKQHTGNWSGKTVGNTVGIFEHESKKYKLIDLPGIYSTSPLSHDERWAVEFLNENIADTIVLVLDATCLERNLILALEVLNKYKNVIICINLIDEAKRKKININFEKLQQLLGVTIIPTSASNGYGIEKLKHTLINQNIKNNYKQIDEAKITDYVKHLYSQCVEFNQSINDIADRKIDKIVMSRIWGFPIMLGILGLIFWITIIGANYPSSLLSAGFNRLEEILTKYTQGFPIIQGVFVEGMFRTLGWVVSVMLPPMAIFFPMFTLLEDLGYLPRMAFNLDRLVKKSKAHGKMILTMCMGFGCNAVGVTACRIIDSPRERLIGILTNSFVPCNGRFPAIIMLATIFFAGMGNEYSSFKVTLAVLGCILFSVIITLLISRLLSDTVLKGTPSSVILELPPYRKPKVLSVIWRSIVDRVLFVLGRAIVVAAPAGMVIWLLQNISINSISLLDYIADFLSLPGNIMGLDGYILTAFILGLPANEIVIPLIIMCYTKNSGLVEYSNIYDLKQLLIDNGWTIKTALCTIIFSLNHFPCSTTLLTIKKETKSWLWTAFAFILPTVTGILLCFTLNLFFDIICI